MARDDDAFFGIGQRLDDALSELDDHRRRADESARQMSEARTTVPSKDRSFSVVFDGRGGVVDVTFHGTKYRNLAPGQLGHMIVETLERGRIQAIEKMAESMSFSPLAGIDLVGIATGRTDARKAIDAVVAPLLNGMSGRGRAPEGSGG